jgi:hypothetical protein
MGEWMCHWNGAGWSKGGGWAGHKQSGADAGLWPWPWSWSAERSDQGMAYNGEWAKRRCGFQKTQKLSISFFCSIAEPSH